MELPTKKEPPTIDRFYKDSSDMSHQVLDQYPDP
jgi:hypothetical protein